MAQAMAILSPQHRPLVRPAGIVIPKTGTTGKDQKPPTRRFDTGRAITDKVEMMRRVEGNRYALFDQVCARIHKTPDDLLLMDMGKLAQVFVQVSGLPIEKFPPDKLASRCIEYARHAKTRKS
jgi:hypothetical protein